MKSPFPGMDPYLERHWGDVHPTLIIYAREALQEKLPAGLLARVEEHVYIEEMNGESRLARPDVFVMERFESKGKDKVAVDEGGTVAVAEPVMIRLLNDEVHQRYVTIVDAANRQRVLTVIEFLSPSNKAPGEGRDKYLEKQRECLAGQVSLVEIDLVRGGQHALSVPAKLIPRKYRSTYQVCVRRGWKEKSGEVYRAPLSERLPAIKIPLRQADKDAILDLQLLIEHCYRAGQYHHLLDYTQEPDPPLNPADSKWADALLRKKKLR